MNDTNLVSFLIKVIADQKAAAGSGLLIWTMISNTVLTPLVTAIIVFINKKSAETKLDQQAAVLKKQGETLDGQTAIVKEIKTDVNSERTAMMKTVSDLRDEVRKLAVEKQELQSEKADGRSLVAQPPSEIADIKKMLEAMSKEIGLLKSSKTP